MPLFQRAEFLDRCAKIKKRMSTAGIDVLLISSPANQFYATGYDGWSFYTPQLAIIAADEDEPLIVVRGLDAPGAKLTVFMNQNRIHGYPDRYVASQTHHPMHFVADLINEKGWSRRKIGVEMDDYYYSAKWHQILTQKLPNAQFIDAFLLVNWIRLIKSPQELEYLRQAGKIAERAMDAAVQKAAAGVRQCDVMAELYRITVAGTPEHGGTFTCKPPNAMAGTLAAAPHLSWTDERLEPGQIFFIEMGGCRHRYHAPLSRCIHIGKPKKRMIKISDIVTEGLNAVLEASRPGKTCEEVEAAWRKCVSRYGIEKESRLGYPVGIGYPPTWGELTASIRPGDKTVLEEGMSFHCVPRLTEDDWAIMTSESFVVTSKGAETYANYPRQLFVK